MNVRAPEESLVLPESLGAKYKIKSCLKYSEQTATYLLTENTGGRTVLLKTASDPLFAESLINEKRILDAIHLQDNHLSATFPVSLYLEQHGEIFYSIRSYIPGRTLEEVCESNYSRPGLDTSKALDYIINLTELLHFLHTMQPPLIHRDIKPQNVVIDRDGSCHFIDMGISRFFNESKRNDTLIMGTRITAPPEQFGYQQTDMRSDLYSIGILLLYCVTGDYTLSDDNSGEIDAAVLSIIRKATMFDPDKRYQTSRELLQALLTARYGLFLPAEPAAIRQKLCRLHTLSGILGALCVLLLAVSIFLYSRLLQNNTPSLSDTGYSETSRRNSSADSSENTYTFREPLIEEAVRNMLNLPDEPVTEEDLQKVVSLHIMGLQILSDDSEVWFKGDYPWIYDNEIRSSGLYLQRGTISSLEDIAHMPNLRSLGLYNQQISDISLLKDREISELGLGYNPLTDLSPLAGNSSIRSLNVVSLDIQDTEVLSTLTELETLNISNTDITALTGLEKCKLRSLNLYQLDLQDYGTLWNLPSLETLELTSLTSKMKEQLNGLPVKDLSVYYCDNLPLDDFSIFPELEILYCSGNEQTDTPVSNPQLPKLKNLDLAHTRIDSLKSLSSLTSLHTLAIYSCECGDYEGLDQLPQLQVIQCNSEQQKVLNAMYPDSNFTLYYQ